MTEVIKQALNKSQSLEELQTMLFEELPILRQVKFSEDDSKEIYVIISQLSLEKGYYSMISILQVLQKEQLDALVKMFEDFIKLNLIRYNFTTQQILQLSSIIQAWQLARALAEILDLDTTNHVEIPQNTYLYFELQLRQLDLQDEAAFDTLSEIMIKYSDFDEEAAVQRSQLIADELENQKDILAKQQLQAQQKGTKQVILKWPAFKGNHFTIQSYALDKRLYLPEIYEIGITNEPVSIMNNKGELYVQSGSWLWHIQISFDITKIEGDKQRNQPALAINRNQLIIFGGEGDTSVVKLGLDKKWTNLADLPYSVFKATTYAQGNTIFISPGEGNDKILRYFVDLDLHVPINLAMPLGQFTMINRFQNEFIHVADQIVTRLQTEKSQLLEISISNTLNPFVQEQRVYMARVNKLIQMNLDTLQIAEII